MLVGRRTTREVFGLVTTLPHSAAHATVFAFSKSMPDFMPAFADTLQRLGGVPGEMVMDRDSSIVLPRSRPAQLHPEVASLFGAFRLRPIIFGPRKPESKGQVERTIGYLETSFLPCGRSRGITAGSVTRSLTPGRSNRASSPRSRTHCLTWTVEPRRG